MPAAVFNRQAILLPNRSRRRKANSRAPGRDPQTARGGGVGRGGARRSHEPDLPRPQSGGPRSVAVMENCAGRSCSTVPSEMPTMRPERGGLPRRPFGANLGIGDKPAEWWVSLVYREESASDGGATTLSVPWRPQLGRLRLPEIGRSLGSGMREFKQSVTGESAHQNTLTAAQQQPPPP